jgi:regulator of protease activity HflC (stomatin/prohibitin superfamily)
MPLAEVLNSSDKIVDALLTRLRTSDTTLMLGVEVIGLSILAIKPTPEIARALEAASREDMQRRADQAIYLRRNAAVEEERRIKESELNTELAVESKRREIDEAKMSAQIALENQRAQLMDRRVENERKEADSRAYALSATLKLLEHVDWRMLMALAAKGSDPRFAIALAFQQMAENAGKIGQLNVTPDLLNSLMTSAKDR